MITAEGAREKTKRAKERAMFTDQAFLKEIMELDKKINEAAENGKIYITVSVKDISDTAIRYLASIGYEFRFGGERGKTNIYWDESEDNA